MAGSIFGDNFRVSTWGESHGMGIGAIVDGCPAGLPLNEDIIQEFLNRRKPGQSKYSTPRKEDDKVTIFSGVFEGKTTGTPISLAVMNENQRSGDYSEISSMYRPGHADYTFDKKYGFRDYRGGGRSSGRETIGRVAAGAIACSILKELGITVKAYTRSIGPYEIDYNNFDEDYILESPLYMPDKNTSNLAEDYLLKTMENKDSSGGVIECIVKGMPAGVGEPVFDKLDANLSKAIMSIGAIKGVEVGDGFLVAKALGSDNNDSFTVDNAGNVSKKTNHCGGILGGMSDGDTIIVRAAVKPTPSIFQTQETINNKNENIQVNIKGRHDPVVVPRAVVVVESMVAITLVDMLFSNMHSTMDKIKKIYE